MLDPQSDQIALTSKGVAYCLAHGREAVGRRIERHLAVATALIAYLDASEPDADLEPSLGSATPHSGTYVEPMGFLKIKPYWMSDDDWRHELRQRHSVTHAVEDNWSTGNNEDREDEHDGREPEGDEPTLGYTEEIDQLARLAMSAWHPDEAELDLDTFEGNPTEDMEPEQDGEPSLSWSIPGEGTWSQLVGYTTAGRGDLEADYSADDGFGNLTAYASDEEDALGCEAIRLTDGTIISDREGTDCGNGVCDDHGVADAGGQMEAFGRVA